MHFAMYFWLAVTSMPLSSMIKVSTTASRLDLCKYVVPNSSLVFKNFIEFENISDTDEHVQFWSVCQESYQEQQRALSGKPTTTTPSLMWSCSNPKNVTNPFKGVTTDDHQAPCRGGLTARIPRCWGKPKGEPKIWWSPRQAGRKTKEVQTTLPPSPVLRFTTRMETNCFLTKFSIQIKIFHHQQVLVVQAVNDVQPPPVLFLYLRNWWRSGTHVIQIPPLLHYLRDWQRSTTEILMSSKFW